MAKKQSTTITTEQIANTIQGPLEKVIERLLKEAQTDSGLAEQVRALESEMGKKDLPKAAQNSLTEAIQSLHAAQNAIDKPLLERIAVAIIHVTRRYGVPLAVVGKGETLSPATPVGEAGRRGQNQQFVLDYLSQRKSDDVRVGDVTKAAETAGLNRSSMPQAIKALEEAGQITSKLPKGAKRNPVLSLA
jgi:hypothetical protein